MSSFGSDQCGEQNVHKNKPISLPSILCSPKRRGGKAEQTTVRNAFSTDFSAFPRPNGVLTPLKSAAKKTFRTVCSAFPLLRLGLIYRLRWFLVNTCLVVFYCHLLCHATLDRGLKASTDSAVRSLATSYAHSPLAPRFVRTLDLGFHHPTLAPLRWRGFGTTWCCDGLGRCGVSGCGGSDRG